MNSIYYKHFKNKPYKFKGTAKHSETLEEYVLYETRYDNPGGKLWIRPKNMFFETVTRDGQAQPRFANIPLKINAMTDFGNSEIAQIASLIENAFGEFNAKDFETVLKNRTHFYLQIASFENTPVGFKLGYQHDGEMFYSWLGAVDPAYRGLGVAARLMEAQHEWCKSQGFKKIQTKTKNKWRDMLILNLKFGFQIVGTYTDEKGEPKIILEKTL